MAAQMAPAKKFLVVLLAIVSAASAQERSALAGKAGNSSRASYRVKFNSGLRDVPGTLSLDPGGITIRDQSNATVLEIADQQLVSAVTSSRGGEMPYIRLSAAFESGEGPRAAAMLLVTSIGWDVAVGVTSLFHHRRHFVTIAYLRDTDPQSETLQVSNKDARKLAEALQARCTSAAAPAEH